MRRLVVGFMAIGLIWASSTSVAAREVELSVIPPAASTSDELAGLFPLAVGGQPTVVESHSGAQWVAALDPETPEEAAMIVAAESLLIDGGAALDEVEIATASFDLGLDDELMIAAVRVPGLRAFDIVDAAVGALVPGAVVPAGGWGWADDVWIAYYLDRATTDDGQAIAYPAADTVWIIDAQAAGDRPVTERIGPILEALPPQSGVVGPIVALPQRVEVPALGIAASFPEDWAVEVLPMTTDEQAVIRRSTKRYGIEGEWMGTVRAMGPAELGRGEAPMCHLIVFDQAELTPRSWISAVTEDNPCYLIDETSTGLVRARIAPADCGREWAPSQGGAEHFALGRDDEIAYLNCWSKEPPGERGSAIAQSIEFVPTEE